MTNPMSAELVAQLGDRRVADFVARWDALEALVVAVYRTGSVSRSDRKQWRAVRRWLGRRYEERSVELDAFWRETRIGGEPVRHDPFVVLLSRVDAADFVGDWAAVQTLPAAREALNHWLRAMIEAFDE